MPIVNKTSHPTRVRGLKLQKLLKALQAVVAPHTGAWIETNACPCHNYAWRVAPHTGAWIETVMLAAVLIGAVSHPTRVRGLKRLLALNL